MRFELHEIDILILYIKVFNFSFVLDSWFPNMRSKILQERIYRELRGKTVLYSKIDFKNRCGKKSFL